MAKLKAMFPKKEVSVQEIHDEFDNACDAFLAQVKEVLKETSESEVENANSLKKLGFRKASNVKKYNNLIETTKDAEIAKSYIVDYGTRYNEKFITEKMVEIICKKYGLVIGETDTFTGEIPNKNAQEIIAFAKRFKEKDRRYNHYRDSVWMASAAISVRDYMTERIPNYIPYSDSTTGQSETLARIKMEQMEMTRKYEEEKKQRQEEKIADPTFMVVGTLDQFDMTGMKVDSQYRIVSDNPDPVVLAQVKGGFLIVTKWGAEADIQEFHNEKEN